MFSFTDIIHKLSGSNKSAPKPATRSQGGLTYNPKTSGGVTYNPGTVPAGTGYGQTPAVTGNDIYSGLLSGGLTMDGYQNNGTGLTYGGSYGGSSGSGGLQVDTSALQDSVRNRIGAIQNAYGALQGQINPLIQSKVGEYLQNYDTQQQGLNKAYGTGIGQTQAMYGARGLGDSSFQGNALDENTGIYNQNLSALNQDKQQKLAGIGQYAQGLQQSARSASDQYGSYLNNLGQYDASQLGSLDASLASALPGVQQQIQGLGTNQQFLDALNSYAPEANQGASQLASKLQQLVSSSAPLFAKKQIAQGLVKSSQLTDPNAQAYYNDYFNKLLAGQA